MVNLFSRHLQQLVTLVHSVPQRRFGTLSLRLSKALADFVLVIGSSAWHSLQQSFGALHRLLPLLHSFLSRSPTNVVDSEAQPRDQNLDVIAKNQCPLNLELPDTPTSGLEAPSIKWLLETSTDPEVFFVTAGLVPQVQWPLDLDVSDTLRQLCDIYTSCFDVHGEIVPSLTEKALASTMALSHLYCGRVLQAYPGRDEYLGQRRDDFTVFYEMLSRQDAQAYELALTTKLSFSRRIRAFPSGLEDCPDSVPEWLSHILPYHFVTGQVDKDVETLAVTVVSKLVCSPCSPSPQIIANCALLACVMVGGQFDKKDIVRIDKSSALRRLGPSLLAQFRQALWTYGGGRHSTGVARRAWNLLHVICRMLDLARADVPSFQEAFRQNLNMCRKTFFTSEVIRTEGSLGFNGTFATHAALHARHCLPVF
ncbi:hypothetical protein BDR03DRAFT_350247 [Suillus americanus]|nr:hypothetical protein BDR03DRAFT_350247 [Suillus americanus]